MLRAARGAAGASDRQGVDAVAAKAMVVDTAKAMSMGTEKAIAARAAGGSGRRQGS